VALVDALGNLARFILLPGHRHDSLGVAPLIAGIDFDALLGDKAFDIDWIRAEINNRGALAVIPPKANRKHPYPLRPRNVPLAPSRGKLLLQSQRVSPHRNTLRQNRHQLRRHDPSRRLLSGSQVNVHRP
jgi:hypothetical protein